MNKINKDHKCQWQQEGFNGKSRALNIDLLIHKP